MVNIIKQEIERTSEGIKIGLSGAIKNEDIPGHTALCTRSTCKRYSY